jgi:predicted phage terminase large subunit-like protein
VKEGAYFYVLEFDVDWMDFEAQIDFVKSFTKRNGYSYRSIARVEPKATGKTLAKTMQKATALNIAEGKPPKGDKMARVHSCQGTLQSGRVLLPKGMAWVDRFLSQCVAFPNAAHDEEVDCLTGMIISEGAQIRITSTAR